MSSSARSSQYSPGNDRIGESDEITVSDSSLIAQQLCSRLKKDKPFTRLGNRCMVTVRPSRGLTIFADSASKEHAQHVKETNNTGQQPIQRQPHVFDISASAYLHASRGKMDHGESGSGKTEVCKMLVRNLCDMSKSGNHKSKVQSNLLKIDSILGAFGNASTPFNQNASCFTQYTEIQFDSKGRMVGLKLIEYLLEKSRASGPVDGGKSFHIFYYLLDGATQEERTKWQLSDPAHFTYLAGSSIAGLAQGQGTAPLETIRANLKSLGMGKRQQAQLWQILAAILHLGNLQFLDSMTERETCSIKNIPHLQMVAEMLGVQPLALQTLLTSRTRMIGRDNVSSFLNAIDAAQQTKYFARSLYAICFGWMIETINQKLCAPDTVWSNFVSILSVPGFSGLNVPGNGFYRLMVNYANERLYAHTMSEIFEAPKHLFETQDIEFPNNLYVSNSEIVAVLAGVRDGIIPIIDFEAVQIANTNSIVSKIYQKHLDSGVLISANSKNISHSFSIHHYDGIVDYDTRGFIQIDADILQTDFVTMIRGNPENPGTNNLFLRNLFSDKLIATRNTTDSNVLVAANARSRTPSLRRKTPQLDDEQVLDPTATVGHIFCQNIAVLLNTLCATQPWFIHCIKPFDLSNGNISVNTILRQVKAFDLQSIVGNPSILYTSIIPFEEFVERYKSIESLWDENPKTACQLLVQSKNWNANDCIVGSLALLLAEKHWRDLEIRLKEKEDLSATLTESSGRNSYISMPRSIPAEYTLDAFGSNRKYAEAGDGSEISDETASHFESEFEFETRTPIDIEMGAIGGSKLTQQTGVIKSNITPPSVKRRTPLRRNWLICTYLSTFCFLPCCLRICGGMKQSERQMAWREKFALCVIIFLMNVFVLFIIVGTGYIICPRDIRYPSQSPGEITAKIDVNSNAAVFMYGDYFEIKTLINPHISNYMATIDASTDYWKASILGLDVTYMFPKITYSQRSFTNYCKFNIPPGFKITPDQPNSSPWVIHGINSGNQPRDMFKDLSGMRKGPVVLGYDILNQAIAAGSGFKRYLVAFDTVYDVSAFYDPTLNPSVNSFFLGQYFKNVSDYYTKGQSINDATGGFNVWKRSNLQEFTNVKDCLDNIFKIGYIDHRNDMQCIISNYILLVFSVILVSVIGFKFVAALQFPGRKTPEDHDKFVICQVPCYTEVNIINKGETSLHRTIDSLANLRYDDKHKLLFIICDGMIIGSGNDRPTPRIVLDILGVDPALDPDSVPFQSLGDGNNQLNNAKVYSGLYELNGHVVPYIVVVKVGKPTERGRPGNRGKRDSQLILMRFLMRVHFNQVMTPLELDIFHHMKNVIGVDPSFYEYVFMVDADTQVHEDSLNHLVSHMTRDGKIAGTCGETSIANDRKSFTSMIQVYEYFISHHLAKAFESLFGSVTCLPGCFCMYRVRTPLKNTPVLIAPGLVEDYSENTVDTLHLKNLLHLGEDRYLTTLTMKHFPGMRTTFCPEAQCQTYAPDKWPVLLSQRRRWINSTVHNLFELLRLGELCGFCCLSMRFVVFIDLIATFIQPSSLIYVGYLIYLAATNNLTNVPIISLILISAVYGFQIIIFLLKTQWQHIGWMIFYLLAIPLFGLYIPVYSFWHFDDFSWGNTRMVVEEAKGAHANLEIEAFDPASVPLMKWSDYDTSQKNSSSNSDSKSKASYATGYGYTNSSVAPSVYSDSEAPTRPEYGNRAGVFPTDEELLIEIRHILSTTDLMKITKKIVRDRLSRLFGVDVAPRKEYIHYCIDSILKNEI